MMTDRLNEIGYDIIGAAFEVRSRCNEWLLESFYEAAMEIELKRKGHKVLRQVLLPVLYKGEGIDGGYRADIELCVGLMASQR